MTEENQKPKPDKKLIANYLLAMLIGMILGAGVMLGSIYFTAFPDEMNQNEVRYEVGVISDHYICEYDYYIQEGFSYSKNDSFKYWYGDENEVRDDIDVGNYVIIRWQNVPNVGWRIKGVIPMYEGVPYEN